MIKFLFAAISAIVMVSESNLIASNKMMCTVQVAPVDTVAPATPTDSSAVSTPVTPQAGAEDSTEQQNQEISTPTETNPTEATEVQASSEQQAVAE